MFLKVSLLALALVGSPSIVPGQRPGTVRTPSWLTAKWTYDDREFKTIRVQLDKLWLERPLNKPAIEKLYKTHVLPYRNEYVQAKYRGLNPKNFYWLIALESYFGDLGILGQNGVPISPGQMLDSVSAPASYEFARVALGAYLGNGNYSIQNFDLADRLLARSPQDILVRKDTVRLAMQINSNKPAVARALKMATQLYQQNPTLVEVFLPLLTTANYKSWRSTKDVAYMKKALSLIDEMLTRREPEFVNSRASNQRLREYYLLRAKEAGIKL